MTTVIVAGKPSVVVPETEIRWAPVAQSIRVSFADTDHATVSAALQQTFGKFPIRLSKEHELVLRAMGSASGKGCTPYFEILAALEKFGDLELTEA